MVSSSNRLSWSPRKLLVTGLVFGAICPSAAANVLILSTLRERAKSLASQPYVDRDPALPKVLKDLNYDTYRLMWYRREKAVWIAERLPFHLQLAHRGYLFPRRVDINLVDGERVVAVPFSTDLFEYHGPVKAEQVPADAGFAGFRLLYPLNVAGRYDEVISFLGASYFRALGRGQVYGVSARGLAIDAGLPVNEEFPYFSAFWIERPEHQSASIVLLALLDSASLTGAYRFVVRPGEDTVVEVEASVFPRRAVRQMGIAPMTSMFMFGEDDPRRGDDHRPEVHDSDGLLMADGNGEWIWRPLRHPDQLCTSQYPLTSPRGFGLLQRDREFDHYRDGEAKSDQRPDIWVEPGRDWGTGRVELVEIPSEHEGNDNIVAFWTADEPVPVGGEVRLNYVLHFGNRGPSEAARGKVIATRARQLAGGHAEYQVDFGGVGLTKLSSASPPEAVVSISRAARVETSVVRNPGNGAWRLTLKVTGNGTERAELRAFLRRSRDVLTETWSYPWPPLN